MAVRCSIGRCFRARACCCASRSCRLLHHTGLYSCRRCSGSSLLPSGSAAAADASVALLTELRMRQRGVMLRNCRACVVRETMLCMHLRATAAAARQSLAASPWCRAQPLITCLPAPVKGRTSAGSSSPASCACRVHSTPGLTGETGRLLLPLPPSAACADCSETAGSLASWLNCASSSAFAGLTGLLPGAAASASTAHASQRCLLTPAGPEGGGRHCCRGGGRLRGCGVPSSPAGCFDRACAAACSLQLNSVACSCPLHAAAEGSAASIAVCVCCTLDAGLVPAAGTAAGAATRGRGLCSSLLTPAACRPSAAWRPSAEPSGETLLDAAPLTGIAALPPTFAAPGRRPCRARRSNTG